MQIFVKTQTDVNALIATDLIMSYDYSSLHELRNRNKLDLYSEEMNGANEFDMIDIDLWYEETCD